MEEILQELWYGHINPWEQSSQNCPDLQKLVELECRNRRQLSEQLSEDQEKLLEKYDDCCNEITGLTNEKAFISGFRLGARLMLAALARQETT